ISLGLAITLPGNAHAEDLGQYGNRWSIEEHDGVEQMLDKQREMDKDGSLRKLQEKYRDDFVHRLENPDPIPGISTATESRTFFVDPSIAMPEPVVNAQGVVVVPAGTRINPLDY